MTTYRITYTARHTHTLTGVKIPATEIRKTLAGAERRATAWLEAAIPSCVISRIDLADSSEATNILLDAGFEGSAQIEEVAQNT